MDKGWFWTPQECWVVVFFKLNVGPFHLMSFPLSIHLGEIKKEALCSFIPSLFLPTPYCRKKWVIDLVGVYLQDLLDAEQSNCYKARASSLQSQRSQWVKLNMATHLSLWWVKKGLDREEHVRENTSWDSFPVWDQRVLFEKRMGTCNRGFMQNDCCPLLLRRQIIWSRNYPN